MMPAYTMQIGDLIDVLAAGVSPLRVLAMVAAEALDADSKTVEAAIHGLRDHLRTGAPVIVLLGDMRHRGILSHLGIGLVADLQSRGLPNAAWRAALVDMRRLFSDHTEWDVILDTLDRLPWEGRRDA